MLELTLRIICLTSSLSLLLRHTALHTGLSTVEINSLISSALGGGEVAEITIDLPPVSGVLRRYPARKSYLKLSLIIK